MRGTMLRGWFFPSRREGRRARGLAAALLAALAAAASPAAASPAAPAASPAAPAATAGECPPARIHVLPSYQEPRGFEYTPNEELGRRAGTGEPTLGLIETAVGWDIEVGIRRRCLGAECRLCVRRIEGMAGFEPGRMRVADKLRGDRCRTEAVLAHEERHSRVFGETTRLGVRRLVDSLARWAERQVALEAAPETVDAVARTRYQEIEAIMEEGAAWMESRARVRNERIDSPRAYREELERMERRCR